MLETAPQWTNSHADHGCDACGECVLGAPSLWQAASCSATARSLSPWPRSCCPHALLRLSRADSPDKKSTTWRINGSCSIGPMYGIPRINSTMRQKKLRADNS